MNKNKVIGIVGSRSRDSYADFIQCEKKFLELYEVGDTIVSGGCPKGGDRFAEILAKKYQVPIMIYYAQWDRLGKGAGFIRNTDIAKSCNLLIVSAAEDRKGGAEDTVKKCEGMGKPVHILSKEKEKEKEKEKDKDISEYDPFDND